MQPRSAGAEAIVLHGLTPGVREATELPILWRGEASLEAAQAAGADAFVLDLDAHDAEELRRSTRPPRRRGSTASSR